MAATALAQSTEGLTAGAARALKVHISRIRRVLNPLGIEIVMNKTEYRQSDHSRYQLVRWLDRNGR
jgi:hypothetical protein